jgi:predicted regulator of Ras-like GTPase activity (Roadblock/LC7/MglB family)
MLKSLFGELGAVSQDHDTQRSGDFAATAILESTAAEVNDRGQIVDRHLQDLFVTGSPAQAMREHFASQRSELDTTARTITLYDPARMWAGSVVKALSDASGRPIERLHLRDQATLATLAMIERTTLPRRLEDTLKIYYADVRAEGRESAAVPFALMERSHLTAVIVGPLHPASIDTMLSMLHAAAQSPSWRCPTLLFMLPVGAVWIANKINAVTWPRRLQVQVVSEPLTSSSAVWNALLAHWDRVKTAPAWNASMAHASPMAGGDFPIKVADLARDDETDAETTAGSPLPQPQVIEVQAAPRAIDPARAATVLPALMQMEGMLGCAVVNGTTGHLIACEGSQADLELAAAAASEVMRAHRRSLRHFGHHHAGEHVDEVLVTAGNRYHVMRSVTAHNEYFVLALLDKLRSNLAMARFRIMEAQQSLA